MLCSHIMQYTCCFNYDKEMMQRSCMSIPEWPVMFYAWPRHRTVVPCLKAAPREQPVQPRCGPVWADLVESVDLV